MCERKQVSWFCSHRYIGSLATQTRGSLQVLTPPSGRDTGGAAGYVGAGLPLLQCSRKHEKLKSGTMVWNTKGLGMLMVYGAEKMFSMSRTEVKSTDGTAQ